MKAVRIETRGGPEILVVREIPDPVCGPGQVKIAVKAAGVNFADVVMRMGMYPDAPPKPYSPGYEVAGTVLEIGAGVSRVKPGDRVMAGTRFGGYATVAVTEESKVLALPDSMTFVEGAAIPVNYITAWVAMISMARMQKGDRILIHNAAGGVGLAAVQLARRSGAEIFGTAGSDTKLQFLREHGVAHAINYRTQDFAEEVRRITSGAGVDLILDPIGGETTKKGYALLRMSGRLVIFGVSSMVTGRTVDLLRVGWEMLTLPRWNAVGLMNANKGVFGLNALKLWDEEAVLGPVVAGIVAGVQEGWLRAHVDRTFPYDQAGKAHEHLQDRKNIGKVVLEMP